MSSLCDMTENCEECGTELEIGQIGDCDSCQSNLQREDEIGTVTNSQGLAAMNTTIEQMEVAYIEAAAALRSKQAELQNQAAELHEFIRVRDELQAHPDFTGHLPETYFSGGELDPIGVASSARQRE